MSDPEILMQSAEKFNHDGPVHGSSVTRPRSRIALEFARSIAAKRVLDVGCGDGAVSAELKRVTGASVACVDASEAAIQICRTRGLDGYAVEIGREPLPFEDQSFDLVFMTEVLEHLVHPDNAMREVRRVLSPNGSLVLSTPNLACLPNRFLLALGLQPLFSEVSDDAVVGRGASFLGQGGQPVGHLRLYTKRALLEFLERCGFVVCNVRGAAFHGAGPFYFIEQSLTTLPTIAMILVLLARRDA